MSECVVRMEMPKYCPCKLAGEYDDIYPCFGASAIPKRWEEFDFCVKNKSKPDWCLIVCSLPERHGRLIDADSELNFQITDYEDMRARGVDVHSKLYSLDDVAHAINYAYDYADVVVPAEKRAE